MKELFNHLNPVSNGLLGRTGVDTNAVKLNTTDSMPQIYDTWKIVEHTVKRRVVDGEVELGEAPVKRSKFAVKGVVSFRKTLVEMATTSRAMERESDEDIDI